MAETETRPDLGRLLRMQAMVTEAAQVEATSAAAQALVRAYHSLMGEMLTILRPNELSALRWEFERLFHPIQEPAHYDQTSPVGYLKLSSLATEAQVGLRRLQGWIQGLIDELTFSERLRLEAEAKIRMEK